MAAFSVTIYSSFKHSRSSSGSEMPSQRGSLEHEVSAIRGSLGTGTSQASSARSVKGKGRNEGGTDQSSGSVVKES